MKIAIFTDTFYPEINGVARTLKRFTDFLEANNISYKIFAPETSRNDYSSTHIYRFKSLPFILYSECRLAIPNLFQMKAELTNFAPDLIHVATPFNIGLCGVYFSKQLNIPLVGSYHTNFDHYLRYYNLQFLTKPLWKYMHWFHRAFQKVFVPSNETLAELKSHGFTNLELWPRGIDCELFHPFYDKNAIRNEYGFSRRFLLSYVGRLAPEKDVDLLLSISRKLPQAEIDWLIIGDGPLREALQKSAPLNMKFTGYLKGQKLAELYSISDLFVFPSQTETFGNVVLEALASGTPVIGANAGGVKNIVKPGLNGFLCKPGDETEFTEAILKLLNNDLMRHQMGLEGRQFALTQTWDNIFDNLLYQYSLVIRNLEFKKNA